MGPQLGRISSPTPITMALSARLKVGQKWKWMKSTTRPCSPPGARVTRSMRLPKASARDEAERQRRLPGPQAPDEHAANDEEGGQEEQQRRLGEDPEGAAGVAGELEVPEAPDGQAGAAVGEEVGGECLGHLVD